MLSLLAIGVSKGRFSYYHPQLNCVSHAHLGFNSSEICVSDGVLQKLNQIHARHFNEQFGLVL